MAGVIGEPRVQDGRWTTLAGRQAGEDELDGLVAEWTAPRARHDVALALRAAGVPAAPVTRPGERIDADAETAAWGLWPMVEHAAMGAVRVDGQPVHMSETDWAIESGAPTLGEHNDYVLGKLLGLSDGEIDDLRAEGVV
jgi:crotonobetainyl-CoA:carnitine CoA-transferase CaiB-like acyl-CoA transferase